MIEPLRISFEVSASREHAFRTWTERIDRWWPYTHSESGEPDLTVVLEPRVGGRIYERTAGAEHDWGVVTRWEPPARLGYRWHLRRTPEEATDVLITFAAVADGRTRVDIEQTSWERLGADAQTWRDRNNSAWAGLLPHFRADIEGSTT